MKCDSLLPQTRGFNINYMSISKSSMVDLITHIRFVTSSYAAKQPTDFFIAKCGVERRKFIQLESGFCSNETSSLFDFSKFLTPNTSYKSSDITMISTNGYSVCIFFDTQPSESKFKTKSKSKPVISELSRVTSMPYPSKSAHTLKTDSNESTLKLCENTSPKLKVERKKRKNLNFQILDKVCLLEKIQAPRL